MDSIELEFTTQADLSSLSLLNIEPVASELYGWSIEGDVEHGVDLFYRDIAPITPSNYFDATGTNVVSGFHILTHTYPVPTTWIDDLGAEGIECHSFLPQTSFHCDVPHLRASELADLGVIGVSKLDPTDKLRQNLILGLSGQDMTSENPYVSYGEAYVSIVLSGTELPSGIEANDDITVFSHSSRFSTMWANTNGIGWLAEHDEIEWIEEKPFYILANAEATEVMHVNDVWSSTNMAAIDSGWSGLDGTGVIVTVADTGLDNGVNNSNMHPDFADHITGILSYPMSTSCLLYTSPSPRDATLSRMPSSA